MPLSNRLSLLFRMVFALVFVSAACSGDDSPAIEEPAGKSPSSSAPSAADSSTSTSPRLPETTSTTRAIPPAASTTGLLGVDGLGNAKLGDYEEPVLASLAGPLGPSTATDEVDAEDCDGGADKRVRWGDLSVWFGYEADRRTFFGWTYGPAEGATAAPALTTADGYGLGATVAQLKSVYGARLLLTAKTAAQPASFKLKESAGRPGGFTGLLSGIKDSDTVGQLAAGFVCPGE